MRDAAQCQDRAAIGQRRQIGGEVVVAGPDLRGDRLVVRRQALHGVGDPAIVQRKPVVARGTDGLRRKP